MEHFAELFIFVSLVAVAYIFGAVVEADHYSNIEKEEKEFLNLPAVTSKTIEKPEDIFDARLVYGSVVISLDYFKRVSAALRSIVGGRVKSYETLLDRGRREAIVRMKHQAKALGADLILNMRFQTSTIGQVTSQKGSLGSFEILAYGTAVKLKNK